MAKHPLHDSQRKPIAYDEETAAIGPEAKVVDDLVQKWVGDLVLALRQELPVMNDCVARAFARAMLLNAAAASIRANVPQDEFMRLVRSCYARAMAVTREIDAGEDN